MLGGSRTEPKASRLAARAFLAQAAQLLVSHAASSHASDQCLRCLETYGSDRQTAPGGQNERSTSMQQSSWSIAVVLCLLPLAHAQALTYCSSHSISC